MGVEKDAVIWESTLIAGVGMSGDEFQAFAEKAAAHGATHVDISEIPKSSWQKESAEPRDPHPEWDSWPVWSRPAIGIFKLVLPPELQRWLPAEEIAGNLALLKERCRILRSLGLRAVLHGHEPMWLPEEVFEAHRQWRGAECEHPGLSRVPHFSPCLDHPEVLGMYRRAMRDLVTALPEVDSYGMLTNDSSAGLCWANTYPGKNGPERCRDRPLIDRVVGLFDALQQGAREAGNDKLRVNMFNCGFWIDGNTEFRTSLKDRQCIDGRDRDGTLQVAGSGSHSWFGTSMYPVLGITRAFSFVKELEQASRAGASGMSISLGRISHSQNTLLQLYEAFIANPSSGPASRMDILRQVATDKVGAENAETLLDIWAAVEEAIDTQKWCCRGSQMVIVGPLMSRWLLMPLVPDIYSLPDEEKLYFQRGRCAKNPIEAQDLTSLMGKPLCTSYDAVSHIKLEYNVAVLKLESAIDKADALAGKVAAGPVADELADLARRLRVLRCVYVTTRNFVEYAYSLTHRNRDDESGVFRDHYNLGSGNNRGREELSRVARSEMDNALELAELVEGADEPVIAIVPDPGDEDGLGFGPNFVEQLRMKARLIMKYWPEYNRLYPPIPEVRQTLPPDEWEQEQ